MPSDRPSTFYTPFKWAERRRFAGNLLPKILSKIPVMLSPASLQQLLEGNAPLPSFAKADPGEVYKGIKNTIKESLVVRDRNGADLVVFLRGGYPGHGAQTRTSRRWWTQQQQLS
jgi:hypothetical protein